MSKEACNQRIQDVENESGRALSPITLEDTPLQSIEEALAPLPLPDLESHLFACSFDVDNLPCLPPGLTRSEAIAVRLYTVEWQSRPCSLYFQLNQALRTVSREAVKPYFAYLKLLLTGLSKLPSHRSPSMTLWRGVGLDVSKQFVIGRKYFWWGFSSCTTNLNVLKTFLGKGPRVVFSINFQSHCCDIKELSCFEQESEILLLPGRCFEVLNVGTVTDDGLTIVHMKEVSTPPMIKGVNLPGGFVNAGGFGGEHTQGSKGNSNSNLIVNSDFKKWISGLGFAVSQVEEYCKEFALMGFDRLDVLELMKESDFERYFSHLPPGHRMKVWNEIKKIQMGTNEKKDMEQRERLEREREQRGREEKERVEREIRERVERVESVQVGREEIERLERVEREERERLERMERERLERVERDRLGREERERAERAERERVERGRVENGIQAIIWGIISFACDKCGQSYHLQDPTEGFSYNHFWNGAQFVKAYDSRKVNNNWVCYYDSGYQAWTDFKTGDIIPCVKCKSKHFTFDIPIAPKVIFHKK